MFFIRISDLRIENGKTQQEIADMLICNRQVGTRRAVSGKTTILSSDTARRVPTKSSKKIIKKFVQYDGKYKICSFIAENIYQDL